jgi:hypothetical protein
MHVNDGTSNTMIVMKSEERYNTTNDPKKSCNIRKLLYSLYIFIGIDKNKNKSHKCFTISKKAPQARVGSHPLHRGREGVGEEEPRSDASSQVESEDSEAPPFFLIYMVLLCNVFFVAIIYFQSANG